MASTQKIIAELAARFAEEVTLEIYGEKGPPESCDIDAIEEDAVVAARAAFDAVIAQALRLQKQQLPDQLPCPKCQELCEVQTEERTIQGRMGPATIPEPVCTCSACGRDFFPSAGAIAAR
jgi:hypothetical protein